MGMFSYMIENPGKVLDKLSEHLVIFLLSWCTAVVFGFFLSIIISRPQVSKRLSDSVISVTGAAQAVPSIAVIAVVFLFTGIGMRPAVIALFLYSLVPVVFNMTSAFTVVPDSLKESARGMGMSPNQILWKLEIPTIIPAMFSGMRTAATINIGTATIASAVGAGGLGELIFVGLRMINTSQIFAGAFPAAVLAIIVDMVLAVIQRLVTSKGLLLSE